MIAASLGRDRCPGLPVVTPDTAGGRSDASLQREAAWATKAMLHFVRGWAQAEGRRWLHLGGGVGAGEDSLLLFKAGFSPLRFGFNTLRAVIMPAEYERLVRAHDPAADPAELDGYFPAYRAP